MDINATGNIAAGNTGTVSSSATTHWDKPLIRSIVSGPTGAGSTSRLGILMIVTSSILWISYYLVVHKALPDFTSLTMWDTTMIGILYGPAKFTEMMTNLKNGPNGL